MKKPMRDNTKIFKLNPKYLVLLFSVYVVISVLFIYNFKAEMTNIKLHKPGSSELNISFPFDSQTDAPKDTYSYHITLKNTVLFSGKLHIIPDDCVEEIKINDKVLTKSQPLTNNCDCINGFYIDIKKQLINGTNYVQIKVKNNIGHFGINVIDKTFYEKYIIWGFILLMLFTMNINPFLLFLKRKMLLVYHGHKSIIKIISIQIAALTITFIMTYLLPNQPIWFWCLLSQFLLLIAIPTTFSIYHNFNFGKIIASLWTVMLLLLIVNLKYLSHDLFSYDYQGHLDYVNYMVSYGEAPLSSGGWSFYHPSLYYRFAALFWNLLDTNNQLPEAFFFKSIQASSLLIFILYCYWSLKTIDFVFKKLIASHKKPDKKVIKTVYLLTTTAFLAWPSNPMTSARVGNDVLFYLFFAMSIYFTLKWWSTDQITPFLIALLCALLDIWSKTNGFILLGIISILLAYKYLKYIQTNKILLGIANLKYLYKFIAIICISAISSYYTFGERFEHYQKDPNTRFVVSNAGGLSNRLLVDRGWQSFTTFDVEKFVKIPFTSSIDDNKGRNSFWYYLAKTSLFGEFQLHSSFTIFLAHSLSFLFLFIIIIIAIGLITAFYNLKDNFPTIVSTLVMLAAMIFFRILYPYSSSSDFRYIFPCILPSLLLVALGMFSLARNRALLFISYSLFIAFVGIAFIFQLIFIFLVS
ncbi:hypothetical protein [Pedobacter foliorum]|uniref:hypothetical protein n=1 Tax=Pedobacter foliorum TaxID=2739058 RepID=UPI0015640392|nr:hypothetical protein [Pedobacter foliorum]NRF38550.1 hypothetical protein [Pedobacter foliorum]